MCVLRCIVRWCDRENLFYKHHTYKAFLQYVLFDESLDHPSVKTPFHKNHIRKVFLQYVYSIINEQHKHFRPRAFFHKYHIPEVVLFDHKYHTQKASLLCVLFDVLLSPKILCDISHTPHTPYAKKRLLKSHVLSLYSLLKTNQISGNSSNNNSV